MNFLINVLKGLLGLEKQAVAVLSCLITIPVPVVVARNWWQRLYYSKTHAETNEFEIYPGGPRNGDISDLEIKAVYDRLMRQYPRSPAPPELPGHDVIVVDTAPIAEFITEQYAKFKLEHPTDTYMVTENPDTPVSAEFAAIEVQSETEVSRAVKVLCQALRDDPSFKIAYVANIAMSMVDEGVDHTLANRGAERFMWLWLHDTKPSPAATAA